MALSLPSLPGRSISSSSCDYAPVTTADESPAPKNVKFAIGRPDEDDETDELTAASDVELAKMGGPSSAADDSDDEPTLSAGGEAAHPRHDLSCGHTGGWRVFALMVLSVALVSLLLAGVRHSARALEHGPTPVPTPAPSVTLAPVCANIDAEVHDLLAELEDTKARLANALDRKAQADTCGEAR